MFDFIAVGVVAAAAAQSAANSAAAKAQAEALAADRYLYDAYRSFKPMVTCEYCKTRHSFDRCESCGAPRRG